MKNPTLLSRLAGGAVALSLLFAGTRGAFASPTATPAPTSTSTPTATPFIPYDAYFAAISVGDARIVEGDSGAKSLKLQINIRGFFAVNNTPIEKDDYKVGIATKDGTAKANSDYLPLATTLDVKGGGGGERTQTVSVSIKGDTTKEGDEVFQANLVAGKRSSFVTASESYVKSLSVKCTIVDDDTPAVARSGSLTVISGVAGEATLSATGKKGATFSYRVDTRPAHGSARIVQRDETSVLSYTSTKDYVGDDTLSIQAFDGAKWGPAATWTIHVVANQTPSLVGVSPNKGSFRPQASVQFALQTQDGNGTGDIRAIFFTISSSSSRADIAQAIAIWFDPVTNLFCLRSDDGRSWSQWVPLGSTVENTQGAVSIGIEDVKRPGVGRLTLSPRISFKKWYGVKTLWARIEDRSRAADGFRSLGKIGLLPPFDASPSSPES